MFISSEISLPCVKSSYALTQHIYEKKMFKPTKFIRIYVLTVCSKMKAMKEQILVENMKLLPMEISNLNVNEESL